MPSPAASNLPAGRPGRIARARAQIRRMLAYIGAFAVIALVTFAATTGGVLATGPGTAGPTAASPTAASPTAARTPAVTAKAKEGKSKEVKVKPTPAKGRRASECVKVLSAILVLTLTRESNLGYVPASLPSLECRLAAQLDLLTHHALH